MPSPENTGRNKALVLRRLSNPKKWSFSKLGEFYGISKIAAYFIFERDKNRYKAVDKVLTSTKELQKAQ